ncbi:MAG: redox-regulated ATPase YchF [Victivallaceae bacterium]|nr:redox-regulated ATPase YchF [Victivallaceae bacterium]
MSFSCGFVGLPNVGKSTLFNALSGGGAEAANFPFCTIEPNTGIVTVPDERMRVLAELENSAKLIPSTLKFIDIAGLVKGASEGQGLGNQFLGHVRSVDAIAHVVRVFEDPDVVHVDGEIDPVNDIEVIMTELMLADLDMLERKLEKSKKLMRSGDADVKAELELAMKFKEQLADGKRPEYDETNQVETEIAKGLGLLAIMPAFICANVDEDNFREFGKNEATKKLIAYGKEHNMEVIPVCAKLEEEMRQLDPEDVEMFLEDLGVTETGLTRVIHTGYRLLKHITFFTAGPMETRAWTITKGTPAPQAAGKIHTDMCRGFIRMEVVAYDDILEYHGWNGAKAAGKLRIEGKDYIVQDGDVIHVRFSV